MGIFNVLGEIFTEMFCKFLHFLPFFLQNGDKEKQFFAIFSATTEPIGVKFGRALVAQGVHIPFKWQPSPPADSCTSPAQS